MSLATTAPLLFTFSKEFEALNISEPVNLH